jgi:predicted acylesterase/phospholipase RssA
MPFFVVLLLAQVGGAPPRPPHPLGVTISGGVSLGTYEAGFMYLFLEQLKADPALELKIVSGASAGSVNSLVAAISSCRPPNPRPLDDPGWQVWGDVGFHQLFDKSRASSAGLFTRDALDRSFERVRALLKEGLPLGCDLVLGVVVTRVTPRQVEIQRGLSVPRLEEKFLIRLTGRGEGKAPKLANYVIPSSHLPQPLLPFIDDEFDPQATDRNINQLRSVIFASAAFPVAFAPQPIEYCLSKPPRDGEVASAKNVECTAPEFLDLFLDGGVFDNNPLRLAYLVAENRLTPDPSGRAMWRDVTVTDPGRPNHEVRHLYLDPDTTAYPPEVSNERDERSEGLLGQIFKLGGGFIETARAKELSNLAAERKDLASRMRLAVSQYPTASEHLNAFVGFFEKDFRIFDFYLGLYDAYRELKTADAWSGQAFDVDALIEHSAALAPEQWKPFTCLLSVFEPGHEAHAKDCEDPALERFRILLQVSVDRLYETCRPTQNTLAYAINGYHHHCTRSRQGFSAPMVPGVTEIDRAARARVEGESSFDFFMRLLGAYGFPFTDLGLARNNAWLGRLAIRRELDDVVSAWADAQKTFAERTIAKTAGRLALNNIQFSPPKRSGHLVLGTVVEAGMSLVPFGWTTHWFQATGAASMNQFFSLVTPGESKFSLELVAGPEFHLVFLSNAILQPRVALRGGVQLGIRDALGTRSCAESSDPRWCTQGVLEGVLVLSVLERVRGQVTWQVYPGLAGHDPRWFNLQFGIGVQFY